MFFQKLNTGFYYIFILSYIFYNDAQYFACNDNIARYFACDDDTARYFACNVFLNFQLKAYRGISTVERRSECLLLIAGTEEGLRQKCVHGDYREQFLLPRHHCSRVLPRFSCRGHRRPRRFPGALDGGDSG